MFYTFVLKWVEMLLKANEKEKKTWNSGNLQIEITCQTSQVFVFMICKKKCELLKFTEFLNLPFWMKHLASTAVLKIKI